MIIDRCQCWRRGLTALDGAVADDPTRADLVRDHTALPRRELETIAGGAR